jgi:hypothetical protein
MANRDNLSSGANIGTNAGSTDWNTEDSYWRKNFSTRPYAQADRKYESFQPGYRYGFESANRHRGRQWNDVENDLRTGWDKFEHRGQSTWENVKHAVRDAWDRVTGHHHVPGDGSTTRTTY